MLNLYQTRPHDVTAQRAPFLTMIAVLTPNLYTCKPITTTREMTGFVRLKQL